MGYINPKDFFDATELRAIVCTSNEGKRFVIFYDDYNCANNKSLPIILDYGIKDGNINPCCLTIVEREPGRYLAMDKRLAKKPIYITVEGFTGCDHAVCIKDGKYIHFHVDDIAYSRLPLICKDVDGVPDGRINNKNITIMIDGCYKSAIYKK